MARNPDGMHVGEVDVDAVESLSGFTVHATVRYRNLWRVRLGILIVRFGAWIAGLDGVEIDD